MNRRRFLKRAGLWLPASFAFPAIVRAQFVPQAQSAVARLPAAAGGGCASTDTTFPHNTLLEGFEDADTPTWTETDPDNLLTVGSDISALTTGKVAGQCDKGLTFDNSAASGNEAYLQGDLGSTIDLDTQAIRVTFMLYVEIALDTNAELFTIFTANPTTTRSNSAGFSIPLQFDGTNMRVRGRSGSTTSTYVNLTASSWNTIELYIDPSTTGSASYIKVNGGTAATFNREVNDVRYVNIGAVLDLDTADVCKIHFDLLAIDQP